MKKPYEEISNKEYRKREGISASDLKKMTQSMAHWKYYHDNPEDSDSPALLFGRASHKMILEPYDFDNEFAVIPNCDRRTKEGKEKYNAFLLESEGKDVITQDTYDQLLAMRDVLYSTPFCKKLIDGEHEKSFFWVDEETGITCKCRPDSFGKIGVKHIAIDYKTCSCAETDKFMKDAIKFGYDIQTAHYIEGLKKAYGEDFDFVFIAQEKTAPYAVNILQADEYFLESGKQVRAELLSQYKECVERDEYPAYMGFKDSMEISSLSLPEWLKKAYTVESDNPYKE